MRKRTPIKNHQEEIQLISGRCIAALMVMIALVCFLILRLGYLQLSKHTLYNTLSNKNSVDLIPIEPPRGLIYDRNGTLLAENIPVFSLDVVPFKVGDLPQALSAVSKIIPLSDLDISQFQKELKQHRRFDEITLKLRLTETEVAKFSENLYRFPGFSVKARLIRHYPFNHSFSHTLGFVGRINNEDLTQIDTTNYSATNYIGKLGIEKSYENILHGTVGYEQVENDASGEPVRILNQIVPIPGKNLYLTLDIPLQFEAEKALAGLRGAIVAIKPQTGEVLAMVSQPSYDPNLFVSGISAHDYQILQDSTDRPLYNRALRGLYPPASTVKPFIALTGLNEDLIDSNMTINDPGWYQIKNTEHIFHDWRHHGHGIVNLSNAIASSCDVYFYDLANRLGIDKLDEALRTFGFGQLTGIDLNEELPGVLSSPQWKRKMKGLPWYGGDTLITGIGQGYMQTTPLQLAVATAALANGGKRYQPYLLLKSIDAENKVEFMQPKLTYDAVNDHQENLSLVINAMKNVFNKKNGTGFRYFGHSSYKIAGKTGTAQVYTKIRNETDEDVQAQEKLPEKLRDHSLFIAFAPADHPKIAIAIVVENSKQAFPIAKRILDYYLLKEAQQNITTEVIKKFTFNKYQGLYEKAANQPQSA